MELFVQQTSLVSPLSEAGKLQLAADYAQLEASLSPLCHKLSDVGRPYRMIRAIRYITCSLSPSVCLSLCLSICLSCSCRQLGGVVVRASDLSSRDREFDSRPVHCRVA